MFLPEAVCCCLQPGSFCMNSYHGTYISVWCMQKKTEISLHNLVDNTTTNCAGIFLFLIYHTTCVCVCRAPPKTCFSSPRSVSSLPATWGWPCSQSLAPGNTLYTLLHNGTASAPHQYYCRSSPQLYNSVLSMSDTITSHSFIIDDLFVAKIGADGLASGLSWIW